MPRVTKSKSKPIKLSAEQFAYLAGVVDSNLGGVKSVGSNSYAAVAPPAQADFIEYLVKITGRGSAEQWVSGRGNAMVGWNLSLQDRADLIEVLRPHLHNGDANYFEKLLARFDKAINSAEVLSDLKGSKGKK